MTGALVAWRTIPDPKDIKTSTFRVPFGMDATTTHNQWKITGTYQVEAKRLPAICVAGEHGRTPVSMSAFPGFGGFFVDENLLAIWEQVASGAAFEANTVQVSQVPRKA